LLLLVALAAALWVLPARWLIALIPDDAPVTVVDASGTLWDGSATLAVGVPALRRALPAPVSWRFSLAGGPRITARHPWLGGPLVLTPAWSGVRVSAQSLQLPASALTTMHALINTLDPGGELQVSWPQRIIGPVGPAPGTRLLDIRWRNATSGLTRVRPMGGYGMTLTQADGGKAAIALTTAQGPLVLQAQGTLSARDGFKLEGKAKVDASASADTRAALQDLLAMIGRRQGDETLIQMR